MLTNFGELDVHIDMKTGRAKVRGSSTSRHSSVAGERSHNGQVAGSNPAPAPTYDSKLEARYAQYLDVLVFCKEIKGYKYHPFTVKLAPKRTYTPDFAIQSNDGQVTIVELKGSIRMKNARDSITRLHVAAANLPMFQWKLVERVKGQWKETTI